MITPAIFLSATTHVPKTPPRPDCFSGLLKINATATVRMRGRLVLNGVTEICDSFSEIAATHVLLATKIWLQTMVPVSAGDTVGSPGYFRIADGYFAADRASFWGCKIG